MRQQFIAGGDIEAGYEADTTTGLFIDSDGDHHKGLPGIVIHDAPWASVAVEVEGGYMAFESVADYDVWDNQK